MLRDLARMEKDLGDLKKMIDQRQTNRESIISRRIDELMGAVDPLQW